jgi:hypothetical protein
VRPGTPDARRVIAWAGWLLAGVGVLGLIRAPRLVFLWAFCIAFGLAKLPQIVLAKLAAFHRARASKP